MKCRVLVPLRKIGPDIGDYSLPDSWHTPGTIWEGTTPETIAQVLFFVRLGACEPADEECEKAHGLTPQQRAEAQLGYRAMDAGIWPEDMAAFRAGVINGYDLDGNFIPGPNAEEESEESEIEQY